MSEAHKESTLCLNPHSAFVKADLITSTSSNYVQAVISGIWPDGLLTSAFR